MEISGIRLRVVGIEHVAIVVRGCRDQLCKAKVALNNQAGLNPFVSSDFFVELNRLQVANAGVIVVVAIRLYVLIVDCAGHSPVVINEPADGGSSARPVSLVYVIRYCTSVCGSTTQAGQAREAHTRINGCAQHVVDEACISSAKTSKANGHSVAQWYVDHAVDFVARATVAGIGDARANVGVEATGIRFVSDDSYRTTLRGCAVQRRLRPR